MCHRPRSHQNICAIHYVAKVAGAIVVLNLFPPLSRHVPWHTWPPAERVGLRQLPAFFGLLLGDIIVSSIVVAKQVLGPPERLQPGFVTIPLDLEAALPITLLASTISLTPGTVSIELTEDRKTLYVHALHVKSETQLIDRIKHRYEKPLKEIFGC